MKNIKKDMMIRQLTVADLEQYNDLLRYAFQVTDEELSKVGWDREEIKASKFPVLRAAEVLGWFEGPRLASQIAVYPVQLNIRNRICSAGYVTGVATYPEYSGMGLMSELIRRCLSDMKARRQIIALLYPYSIPFYRHKGWEMIADKMTFRLKDSQLPRRSSMPGRVRRVKEDDEDLLTLHDAFARKTHGCLIRNQLAWEEYWRWDQEDETIAIYYGENDEPLGYMVYLLKDEIFQIKEMIYLNQEAHRGLWNYVSAHESMIEEIAGDNYYNHTIAFMLEDSDIRETIRPYIMARIVDVEAFLGEYRFPDAPFDDSITLEVEDPMLEWNRGLFTIDFSQNPPRITRGAGGGCKARMDIGILTALLMGYKRPSYLKKIDRLDADDRAVEVLERILPHEKPYFSDYI